MLETSCVVVKPVLSHQSPTWILIPSWSDSHCWLLTVQQSNVECESYPRSSAEPVDQTASNIRRTFHPKAGCWPVGPPTVPSEPLIAWLQGDLFDRYTCFAGKAPVLAAGVVAFLRWFALGLRTGHALAAPDALLGLRCVPLRKREWVMPPIFTVMALYQL